MATSAKPLTLLAEVYSNADKRAEVGDIIRPVAEFESKQDPCGAYCLTSPLDGDEKSCVVFETYDDIDYVMNTHLKSEAFAKMGADSAKSDAGVKPGQVKKFSTKGGFLSREDKPPQPFKEQFIWIAEFKANPGKRAEFMEALLTHTANVQRTEDETLSFVALESVEDDVSLAIFERYTSEKYFKEVHATSDSMKEFREKIGPLMAEGVRGGYKAVAGFVDKREAIA